MSPHGPTRSDSVIKSPSMLMQALVDEFDWSVTNYFPMCISRVFTAVSGMTTDGSEELSI